MWKQKYPLPGESLFTRLMLHSCFKISGLIIFQFAHGFFFRYAGWLASDFLSLAFCFFCFLGRLLFLFFFFLASKPPLGYP